MKGSRAAVLLALAALPALWPLAAGAADVTIDVVESIAVSDGTGALPPAEIEVSEPIGVEDGPGASPPAAIDVVESIGVADTTGALPPAAIDVVESIGVADTTGAFPPAAIDVVESIGVADTTGAFPPAAIDVVESIAVADAPQVLPPLLISVPEAITVSDQASVLPPVSITVHEAVAVDDEVSVAAPDLDGDGVDDATEDASANGGDGNDDGIPDRLQADVASLPTAAGGQSVTLAVAGGCGVLSDVASLDESSLPDDTRFDYPLGLVRFRLPCANATLTTFWHGTSHLSGPWRQYGPTVPGQLTTTAWYTLGSVVFDVAEVGGIATATATSTLADGMPGDDTDVDGAIVATGGPAVSVAPPLPTLEWDGAPWLIAALLLTLGWRFAGAPAVARMQSGRRAS